jgi:hypothetical protein
VSLQIPDDVIQFVREVFGNCNQLLANDLSTFPAIHEESLDMNLISYFARHQAPVRLRSNWVVRIDAHFIGGGRHFGTWEVADIGLMMVFRRRGKVFKSKICLLQSKKLYASPLAAAVESPHIRRFGLGRLLVTDEEHESIVKDKILAFDKSSRYQAFRKGSDQQQTMEHFERRWGTDMYYLFYNPVHLPFSVKMPQQEPLELTANDIGCRVVQKRQLDQVLTQRPAGYSPTFDDLERELPPEIQGVPSIGGWRLEDFAADLVLKCKAGLVDDSPNFESLVILMNQKQRPMSCALSITFDIQE